MAKKSRKPQRRSVPSEAEILEFVRESKGAVGKREIARAFGLKGSDRIALKQILRDLKEKGVLSSRGPALHGAGELPQLAPLDIVGVNADGELEAAPVEWDESLQGAPPKVIIAQAARTGPATRRRRPRARPHLAFGRERLSLCRPHRSQAAGGRQ